MPKNVALCCPYCGFKNNIKWGSPDVLDAEQIKRRHFCGDCQTTWYEIYTLTSIKDNNGYEIWIIEDYKNRITKDE